MPLAATDFYDVLIALIAAIPSTITALCGFIYLHRLLRTPSGTSIGRQVEDVNHTARSNWHMLSATSRELGIIRPERALEEREQVDGLEDDVYETPLKSEGDAA